METGPVNRNFINLIFPGRSTSIEYLIDNGANVPQNLPEWEQVVIACAVSGKFTSTLNTI